MLKTTPRKTGRPRAIYKDRNGNQIEGLFRLKDGRWRISGPNKTTFTEPDEARAIAKFHSLTRQGLTVAIPNTDAKPGPFDYIPPAGWHPPKTEVDETAAWNWVRDQIITRPQYVAARTSIEQIGYLQNLPKPTPSPTLAEVGSSTSTTLNSVTTGEQSRSNSGASSPKPWTSRRFVRSSRSIWLITPI